MFISLQSYHHDVWAIQKEIKDAYPKKVCHMPTRHVKKKREEKRCIPKEGMPHTHKVCQKKERKYSPYQIYYKGERVHIKKFHLSSTKNIHTLAHLDQGLWLVSPLDPVFDLAKYEKQVRHHILHTYRSTKKKPLEVGWKKKAHKNTLVRNETHWAIREITRGTTIFLFKNYIKPPDWRLNKGVVNGTLQAVLTLNRQRWA